MEYTPRWNGRRTLPRIKMFGLAAAWLQSGSISRPAHR
jgi:hypothetical protein